MIVVQDKRTIKTERAIREAFAALLRKKELSRITVNEICDKAQISRNTFYSHYADKYLLIEQMTADFIQELMKQTIENNTAHGYEMSVRTTAQLYFDYLSAHRDQVGVLTSNDPQFWQTFADQIRLLVTRYVHMDEQHQVFTTYSTNAMIGCYRAYFEGRLSMTPTAFVHYLTEIALKTNDFMKPFSG